MDGWMDGVRISPETMPSTSNGSRDTYRVTSDNSDKDSINEELRGAALILIFSEPASTMKNQLKADFQRKE